LIENIYSLVVAVIAATGIYMVTRYSSPLRIVIGLELLAGAATAALVFWGGTLGFYLYMVVVDTAMMALAAAVVVHVTRKLRLKNVDEANKLKG